MWQIESTEHKKVSKDVRTVQRKRSPKELLEEVVEEHQQYEKYRIRDKLAYISAHTLQHLAQMPAAVEKILAAQ